MRSPREFLRAIAGTSNSQGVRLALMAGYLLLIITCYTTTKAVRDSLFISEIGPAQLPLLYVMTAVSMAAISAVYPRALRKIGLYSLVQVTSATSVASLLVFWWFVDDESRTSLYILYVWVSLFGAITASQAWSLASHVFDAREARRSFAWVGLGGVVGGIVGGSLARIVALWQGTEMLLPICAGLMGGTIVILRQLARRQDWRIGDKVHAAHRSDDSGSAVFSQIRKSPYLSMIVLLLLSGVIVEAFVDYEFKVIAHQAFDSKDRLTSFFGTIASYGGLLALFVQMLITSPLLKRFGVGAAIVILPSALLAGFVLVALRPGLWAVSILKLTDGCLSYSVHRSGMELLFVPIPSKLRASVKALIDLLVDRVGRAAGGVLLFALTAGLSLAVPSLSVAAACALVVWLAFAVAIRRNYVHAFRVALEKKVIEPEALGDHPLDSTISRALLQALGSSDDRQVLYALDLLAGGKTARWRQHLNQLIEHKTPAVRRRTIAVLTERRSFSPQHVEKRLLDEDLDVRIEAIRHFCEAGNPTARTKLREFLDHTDYRIVLAAIHCIARYRPADGDLIDELLIEKALAVSGEHGVSAKTAAARGIAIARPPRATQFLNQLLQDSCVEVVRQSVRASGEIQYEGAIPILIPMLGRTRLRREAREALLKLGAPALSELRARFQDDATPIEVRARIPKVLSLSGKQDAADFLFESLRQFTPRLDTALLKGLNAMRTESPEIRFERDRVSSLIGRESERHQQLSAIRRAIRPGELKSDDNFSAEILVLLHKALGERMDESVERVFRLLHLIYSPSDIQSVYFSFNSRPALRASAVEFLDNLIEPPLRALVVPLVEDGEVTEPLKEPKGKELSRIEAIQMLLGDDDEWLRTIASELDGRWRAEEGVPSSRTA